MSRRRKADPQLVLQAEPSALLPEPMPPKKKRRRQAEPAPPLPPPSLEPIIPASQGMMIPAKLRAAGFSYPDYVREKCEAEFTHSAVCLSCMVHLPSQLVIEEHLANGQHVLARVCRTHSVEAW